MKAARIIGTMLELFKLNVELLCSVRGNFFSKFEPSRQNHSNNSARLEYKLSIIARTYSPQQFQFSPGILFFI